MRISRIAMEGCGFFCRPKWPHRHFPHGTKLLRRRAAIGFFPCGFPFGFSLGSPLGCFLAFSLGLSLCFCFDFALSFLLGYFLGFPPRFPHRVFPMGAWPALRNCPIPGMGFRSGPIFCLRRSLVPCGKCRRGDFCRPKNRDRSVAIREIRKNRKPAPLTASGA